MGGRHTDFRLFLDVGCIHISHSPEDTLWFCPLLMRMVVDVHLMSLERDVILDVESLVVDTQLHESSMPHECYVPYFSSIQSHSQVKHF